MKPYPKQDLWNKSKQILNYRFSNAKRNLENAFGILSAKFRIFYFLIHLELWKVNKIVLASCALHNSLIRNRISQNIYLSEIIDTLQNNNNLHFANVHFKLQSSNINSSSFKINREEFTNVCSKKKAVIWLWNL